LRIFLFSTELVLFHEIPWLAATTTFLTNALFVRFLIAIDPYTNKHLKRMRNGQEVLYTIANFLFIPLTVLAAVNI
jgi:hypothetical protein